MRTIKLIELLFGDDTVIVAESEKDLQQNVIESQKELEKINMEINVDRQRRRNELNKSKATTIWEHQ